MRPSARTFISEAENAINGRLLSLVLITRRGNVFLCAETRLSWGEKQDVPYYNLTCHCQNYKSPRLPVPLHSRQSVGLWRSLLEAAGRLIWFLELDGESSHACVTLIVVETKVLKKNQRNVSRQTEQSDPSLRNVLSINFQRWVVRHKRTKRLLRAP